MPSRTRTAASAATSATVTARPARKSAAAPKASAKAAPRRAPKPAAKDLPKAVEAQVAAPPVKVPKPGKAAKEGKLRRKPVRDSFTMPESDFALIDTLKARALGAQRAAKKSELLRAGLHALATLDAAALVASLNALAPVKVGRPRKGH